MSTENVTDSNGGQAVPSIGSRGADDFASLIGGETGGGKETQVTETTQTIAPGTSERPALDAVTPRKPADASAQPTQQGTTQQTAQQPATTVPATSPGLDKAVLDQIVETATRAATSAADARSTQQAASQVRQDKKELTAEEFSAKYQLPVINEATIQAILDADPKKGASMLREILIKNMSSAVLMAKDVIDNRMTAMREEMNPHLTSWQNFQREQRETKMENDFYTANADLVNEKPLVKEMQDAIYGRIASGQLKAFATPQDALKAVADATRAVLTRMGKATSAGGTAQQQSQQQGQGQRTHTRQMTAASTAGQSGTGQAAGKSDEEKIFGADYV